MALERSDARPDSSTDARPDSSTDARPAPPSDARADPDRVRRRLRRRAEGIERRQVEEAVSKLEARGDLTDEQRETVRLLGAALRRRLTSRPEAALERSAPGDATARALARLFDADGGPATGSGGRSSSNE
ncbi:glutamyl-tRNA reductase [Halorubrum yunnanense]|uniref:Glutamyl-tRNA reductase n=1 Tax=Halorubrum yunnanense TaxID=1526162 RepID=A0ABD5Y8D4_9EURY|nr:glutamyl-tRNA reductase [Halorubrum yunnanense]